MTSLGTYAKRISASLMTIAGSTGLMLLCLSGTLRSQSIAIVDTAKSAVMDSAKSAVRDSARSAVTDSTRSIDSLRVRFIPGLGSLRHQIDSSSEFHSSQFVWTDARYFGNLVWKLPGFVYRDLGEPAKPGELNAWGADWRGISILMDGRPMNDPITGTYNINDIPLEFVEQVEEYSGSEAAGEAWNAPGAALNFVTRQYNTLRPITKVRFVQSPGNNLLTDGLFTQNLLRGLNLMFGFQRQVSDGMFNGVPTRNAVSTPQGATVDNWNVRTRLRYNPSDRFNIAITDFYTKDINGLNGGIDLTQTTDIFNNVQAFVNSPNALETVARRDVSFAGIAKLTNDSTLLTQFNGYYTHLERSFTNPGTVLNLLAVSDFHYAEVRGIRIQQSLQSSWHASEIGIQAEHSQYSSRGFFDSTMVAQGANHSSRSITSAFASTSLHPVEIVNLGLSGRFDNNAGESAPSYGAELKISPVASFRLIGDYEHSYRFPTFQESSWADSTILRSTAIRKEQHAQLRAGIEFLMSDHASLSLTGFDRKVSDAIVFQPAVTSSGSPAIRVLNVPQTHAQGVTGSLALQLGPIAFDGTMLYTQYKEADTAKLLLPNLILSGELTYRNKFFNNALDAKFGVRTHFMSHQRGMTFNPRMMLYTENTTTEIGQWTRLDAYAVLKIGDAYITLAYENFLNAAYLITPVYPMPGGLFRIGVNWVFLD